MSFTKQTLEHFSASLKKIFEETTSDNDLTGVLENLNSLMEIQERFVKKDSELEFYWNEIISDTISVLQCGISGQYRLAVSGLRNILELACSVFYYLDHKIELKLFINENFKAETVSALVNMSNLFKTNYIRAFYSHIDKIETKPDSVASFLNITYSKLCDVVHGRYKSLTMTATLNINYSKDHYKKFEKAYKCTLSAIATMYVLRFDDFTNVEINALVKESKTINIP